MLDLVVNHSSDEHRWFMESRSSKDNPYRDYYIWREGKEEKSQITGVEALVVLHGNMMKATNMYYLHTFSKKTARLKLGQSSTS